MAQKSGQGAIHIRFFEKSVFEFDYLFDNPTPDDKNNNNNQQATSKREKPVEKFVKNLVEISAHKPLSESGFSSDCIFENALG